LALLIDSSIFIRIERSGEAPGALLERLGDESIAISAMTASELLHGVHRAESALRRGRREQFVETVLRGVPVIPFTLEIARTHSQLWADQQKTGTLIGAHDLLIAATAITHGLTLLTHDKRHFERVEGLKFTLWSKEEP
jgi:tRNA(fMet)-specific endonuclease VapC